MNDHNPKAKKRKMMKDINAKDSSPLGLLDDDCLSAIFLRTQAADHPNLRLSCKRFNDILTSVDFRKKRSYLGYAEVKVELLDPFQQYEIYHQQMMEYDSDGDSARRRPPSRTDRVFVKEFDHLGKKDECGCYQFGTEQFRVYVDGVPLHKAESRLSFKIQILPRRVEGSFYELCDVYSQELAVLGTSLFSKHGKPKANSIKKALQDDDNRRPMLYISTFSLPFEYRSNSSTVGPLILQEILRVFKDEYSLAIYIPWYEVQYSLEDLNTYRYAERRHPFVEPTDEEIRREQKRKKYLQTLINQDMRQFFRAGFQQVKDTKILKNRDHYVFVTRKDATQSLLTEQETLDLKIASPPPQPIPKTGLTRELFQLVKEKSSFYNTKMNYSIKPLRDETNMNVGRREKLAEEEANLDDYIERAASEIQSVLENCETNEDRFRVILDSDSIHACVANGCLPLLNKILGLLPEPSQQTQLVLNHPDDIGFTPIMIVAEKASRNASAITINESIEFIEVLISLGADKNIIHSYSERSALGIFREGFHDVSLCDIYGITNGPSLPVIDRDRMERVLTPDFGPTVADEDALHDEDAFDDDDDDDEEEEDFFHDDDDDY